MRFTQELALLAAIGLGACEHAEQCRVEQKKPYFKHGVFIDFRCPDEKTNHQEPVAESDKD